MKQRINVIAYILNINNIYLMSLLCSISKEKITLNIGCKFFMKIPNALQKLIFLIVPALLKKHFLQLQNKGKNLLKIVQGKKKGI